MVGCSKDENTYDFNKVIPGNQVITGDSVLWGNGAATYTFYAIPRGGSSYNWELLQGPASIKRDSSRAFLISITSKSNRDTSIQLKVTETTQGGVIGPSTIKTLFVQRFCDFNINAFPGYYQAKAFDYARINITGNGPISYNTFVEKVDANKLLIKNLISNYPVQVVLQGDPFESLTITNYSENYNDNGTPRTITIKGTGHYNVCKAYLALDYNVSYAGTNVHYIDTLRKQ